MTDPYVRRKRLRLGAVSVLLAGFLVFGVGCPGGGGSVQVTVKGTNLPGR